MFKACSLLTPYYRLFDESLYKLAWSINLIGKIAPHYILDRPSKTLPSEEWLAQWGFTYHDKQQIRMFTPKMASLWLAEQAHCEKVVETIQMPLLFAEAEHETLVSNIYIRKFYEINAASNERSQFLELKGVDHSNVIFVEESVSLFARETVKLFNNAIGKLN